MPWYVVASLVPVLALGMGWLVWWPTWHGQDRAPAWADWAGALLTGQALLLALLLGTTRLSWCVGLAALGGVAGWLVYARQLWRSPALRPELRRGVWRPALALALLAVLLLPWLGLPLHGWDGRSIWFFHAKWLYYAGGLAADGGWRQPELAFSHPDYPLLLPALAALAAHLAGYWNEHLPQLGLAWLALGPLLAAAAWGRTPVSGAILLLGLPALAGPDLWQGQVDAHLALLVGVGLAWLARAHSTGRRGEAVLGWLLLTLPLSLKNEALLALLLAIVVWDVAHWRRWRGPALATPPNRWTRAAWWPVAAALLPWALWQIYKALWGLRNDLLAGWPGLLGRVIGRMHDGTTLGHIGAALASGLGHAGVALAVALLVALALRRRPPLPVLLTALIGLLYAGALGLVYLTTPHDVAWQVQTSAARVLLTAQAALITALALLVEQWELAWPLRRPPPA